MLECISDKWTQFVSNFKHTLYIQCTAGLAIAVGVNFSEKAFNCIFTSCMLHSTLNVRLVLLYPGHTPCYTCSWPFQCGISIFPLFVSGISFERLGFSCVNSFTTTVDFQGGVLAGAALFSEIFSPCP